MTTKIDEDVIFRRRNWLLKNIDWLMSEVVFHRTNEEYFWNDSAVLWHFDAEDEGTKVV